MSETDALNPSPFAEPVWGIVELMGHNVIAGQISEVAVAGSAMLRVDVPEVDGMPAFTKFYGGSAIYAITPTDEASALHAARHFRSAPVSRWTVPYRELPAGPAQEADDEDWEEQEGFVEDTEIDF